MKQKVWTPDWNLSTIPDPALRSEWARRNAWKATTGGARPGAGRPSVPTRCERCGEIQPSARAAWMHCRESRE